MITLYRAPRHGVYDASDVEGAVPRGKPYATHVNGRLVLARDLPSKRNSTGVSLLGEAFGGIRTSKVLTRRVKSSENLKKISTPLLAGTPYDPHQQVPDSMSIPQPPFPTMAPMLPTVLGPPPPSILFPCPMYPGPPPNTLFPTTPSFPQFAPMQPYPPQPLPGRYAISKQARNISQPAAAFEDLKQVDEDFLQRSFSEPLKIKNNEPVNKTSGPNDKPSPQATETVIINKHVCANCGRIRSRRYHHNNPLKPGENPVPGFCHKCQRDDSSVTSNEGKRTRYRSKKPKEHRKIQYSSSSHSARSSSIEVAIKNKRDKRSSNRYSDPIVEESSPKERAIIKVPQMKDLPRRMASIEDSIDAEDLSDQNSIPRARPKQPNILINRKTNTRRSFERRVPVVHFDAHSSIRRTTKQQRVSSPGELVPIRYRTVLATPVYEDETSAHPRIHRREPYGLRNTDAKTISKDYSLATPVYEDETSAHPRIHRREPYGLRSTDAKTISKDENNHQDNATSYTRETRTENRREGRSYDRDYHDISSQSAAAPEEAREAIKRVRSVDPLTSKVNEEVSRRKVEHPGFSGRGSSERAWTNVRRWDFEKSIHEQSHEYRSSNDSSESDNRSSHHRPHDSYEREISRRSYRRNESVDSDLASSNSSREFWEVDRLARQNLSPKPLPCMTPSSPQYTSGFKVPPKVPTPPKHHNRGNHQSEPERLSPTLPQRAPRRNWTDGQNDSLEYTGSSSESTPPKHSTEPNNKAESVSSPSMPSPLEASPSAGSSLLPNNALPKPKQERRMSNGRPAFGREATDNGTELLNMSIFEAKIVSPTNSHDSLRENKDPGTSIVVGTNSTNAETPIEPSTSCPPPPSYLHEIPADSLVVEYDSTDNDSNLTLLTSKNLRRGASDLQANETCSKGTREKKSRKAIETQGESSDRPSTFDIRGWNNTNATWGLKSEFDFGDNQDCWRD